MKRIVSVLLGAMFAVAGMSAAASAYPPDGVVLSASATQLSPGEAFTVTLTGCTPGETVVFEVTGSTAEATCEASSDAAATATLIAPMEPGTYTVTARGLTSGVFASIEITVVGPDERPPSDDDQPPALDVRPVTPPGQLPATGSSSTPVLQMAAISLLAGLGLVAVAYRRRIASA